jgi:hypothetical protein
MSEDKKPGAPPDLDEAESPDSDDEEELDEEARLARRMFLRAGLIAGPLALATFTVDRPARAQATCQPHWCSPGEPCNPVLCGPQICNPFD